MRAEIASASIARNAAAILESRGDYAAAIDLLVRARSVFSDDRGIAWRLGYLLMREGRYAEGLPLAEAREFPGFNADRRKPQLSFPEWDGGAVRRLAVLPEQGLGDQIMWGRYVAELVRRRVEVDWYCPPSLARLMAPVDASIRPAGSGTAILRADAWAMIGSLPHLMGAPPGQMPPADYLRCAPTGSGIGLMARCSGVLANGVERSLPAAQASRLLAATGAHDLHPEATGAVDFAETATLVSKLSLVISVDTSVAHLAAALGKPVWVLLPFVSDWRWGHGPNTPWCPTARLFRQSAPDDWATVIDAVLAAL